MAATEQANIETSSTTRLSNQLFPERWLRRGLPPARADAAAMRAYIVANITEDGPAYRRRHLDAAQAERRARLLELRRRSW